MSRWLNQAIYARLCTATLTGDAATAQTALLARLGTITLSSATTKKAVHLGNKSAVVSYPAITFRPSGGLVDNRFHHSGTISEPEYDFEIWENANDANTVTDIADYVEKLLLPARGVSDLLVVAAGKLYQSEMIMDLTLIYDDKIRAWAGLMRFRFVEARY